ncbi:MAG: metal ABC transporter substrate-binding protein [Alphaproteobacteria bacterium]|nr:metal ABC transporter substrate-binding protein [Alphaproteobacteria bacterium]
MRKLLAAISIAMSIVSLPLHAAPLKVVASFSILGDMVKQVGGDLIEVETLVGPDGDAHVFQPTPADGKKVARASIVFINGLGFEGWIERLVKSADYKGKLVTVSTGLNHTRTMTEEEDEHDHGHGHKHGTAVTDPHAWQSLSNGRLYINNIAKALSEADTAHAAQYKANAAKLDSELAALDSWVKAEIAQIPASKRKVITSHDAFGYFSDAYGVTFKAPVGISTEAEPSAKGMKEMITQLKQEGVKAVFFENMASEKVIKQLAEEAKVSVGAPLYADALSPKDGPASSYQAMFKYNAGKLVEGMKLNQ